MPTTDPHPNAPTWCVPGATLYVTENRDGDRVPDLRWYRSNPYKVTVLRVTKTLAVVAQDTDRAVEYRFRLDGPDNRPVDRGRTTWISSKYLAPADAPDVVAVLAETRERNLAGTVEELAHRWRRNGDRQAAADIAPLLQAAGIITSYTTPEPEQDPHAHPH